MIAPPDLPTPEAWVAMSFHEQVGVTLRLNQYVWSVLAGHLAARQSEGRALSEADMARLEAMRSSLNSLRHESIGGLAPGSLERSIATALDALGIAGPVRVS